MTWTLAWTWAGITQTSPVEVDWTDTAELTGVSPARRASLVLRPLGVDVLEVAAGPAARVPGMGALYRGAELVLAGRWRDVRYQHGAISLTLGEAEDEPDVLWPGSATVVIRHDRDDMIQIQTEPGVWREVPNGIPQASGKGKKWVETVFSVTYRIAVDMWGPIVFGAPGPIPYGVAPGSPAYLLDPAAQDYGDGLGVSWRLIIHRGSRPAATEVQMWFPGGQSTDRLTLDTRGDGEATVGYYLVRHATDDQGYPYAYVGVPVPTVALDGGGVAVVTGPLPSPDRPAAVSWSAGGAMPGGAGSVLAFLLTQSSREVDLPLWTAAAEYLDRYDLAGYIDARVDPMSLVRSILEYLPVAAVRGPRGLEPRIHPWVHRVSARRPIEAGRGFARASDIEEGEAPVTSAEVRYGVGPASPDGALSYVLPRTPYGDVGAGWGARDVQIRTDWVWSQATAARIASDVLRLQAGGRRVAYLADPAIYGAGGSHPLTVGDTIALTDADAHLDAVSCYVARTEEGAASMRIELVMRDDLLGAA